MALSRRAAIIGLPMAASGLVVGSGVAFYHYDSTALPTVAIKPPALADGRINGGLRGGVRLSGVGFPSVEHLIQPSDAINEACLNGEHLSVNVSDVAGGRRRGLTLLLYSMAGWPEDESVTLDLAQPSQAEMFVYNNPDPLAASTSQDRYAYRACQGTLLVKRTAQQALELVFAPTAHSDVLVEPMLSTSVNAARSALAIKYDTPTEHRTMLVRLVVELEKSV